MNRRFEADAASTRSTKASHERPTKNAHGHDHRAVEDLGQGSPSTWASMAVAGPEKRRDLQAIEGSGGPVGISTNPIRRSVSGDPRRPLLPRCQG